MLHSIKTYIHDRRSGLSKVAGLAGGLYVVRGYVKDRLEEVKDRLEEERVARNNLKRRFDQNREDVAYTVLALVPTLSEQILKGVDVEGLIEELQTKSRARTADRRVAALSQRPPSSLASSVDMIHEKDAHSDQTLAMPSSAVSSDSGALHDRESNMSSSGWVNTSEAQSSPVLSSSGSLSGAAHMSDSILTNNTHVSSGESASVDASVASDSLMSSSMVSESNPTRSKAELWNEVKILTVTRTLTTLYSMTLLSLFTTIQLTLLARLKYINSVIQIDRDERIRETMEAELSMSNLLTGGGQRLQDLMAGNLSGLLDDDGEGIPHGDDLDEEVENKFLTMSWWILHVGWKDVAERVRRGVEEVFEGVSLKSKLAAIDLHRLVSDVRRRVEHEVTFEGNERRINFLSTLLPPTPETTQHVLTQGGFTSQSQDSGDEFDPSASSSQISHSFDSGSRSTHPYPHPQAQDPRFTNLLSETRTIISSSDFACVLEICLDQATDILFSGLEKSVFVTSDPPLSPGEEVRIRLAGLLPGLARWSQLALNALPNELIDNHEARTSPTITLRGDSPSQAPSSSSSSHFVPTPLPITRAIMQNDSSSSSSTSLGAGAPGSLGASDAGPLLEENTILRAPLATSPQHSTESIEYIDTRSAHSRSQRTRAGSETVDSSPDRRALLPYTGPGQDHEVFSEFSISERMISETSSSDRSITSSAETYASVGLFGPLSSVGHVGKTAEANNHLLDLVERSGQAAAEPNDVGRGVSAPQLATPANPYFQPDMSPNAWRTHTKSMFVDDAPDPKHGLLMPGGPSAANGSTLLGTTKRGIPEDDIFWKNYVQEAETHDKETLTNWNQLMDVLLVFAALFSAILTSFLIEFYKLLQPDEQQTTNDLLRNLTIVMQGGGQAQSQFPSSAAAASSFRPSASSVWINALWFSSLTCSLGTAMAAILVKQWLQFYLMNLNTGTMYEIAQRRQQRYNALVDWHVSSIISVLPLVMQLAVILFALGLVIVLWKSSEVLEKDSLLWLLNVSHTKEIVDSSLKAISNMDHTPDMVSRFLEHGVLYNSSKGLFPFMESLIWVWQHQDYVGANPPPAVTYNLIDLSFMDPW
ncbi:Peroxin-3-domain-containing protein [Infundibulicybe gibba]|nr:Peroxin-3-domain-containing protein [Infundibulicybe gibba]